jgi:acetyl-CoA acetyltransferase
VPEPLVVSWGESPYEKRDGHELYWHLWRAAAETLERAGLAHTDVDGLGVASFMLPPGNVATFAEHLGMRLSWAEQGAYGGASVVVMLGRAADAIRLGRARAILLLSGDAFTVATHDAMLDGFTPAMGSYLAPHGFGGANGIFALVQRLHQHRYGSRREQLGRLAVRQRQHALLNPNALFKVPLTLQDYLDARLICEPLGLYDCVMPCSGAHGVLVVSDDVAQALDRPLLRVLAVGEAHNAHPQASSALPGGFEVYAGRLFEEAGLTRGDVDLCELYDDYPIMVAIQLERYGFCAEGQGAAFIEATDTSIAGELPVNTGGGQLSCGQSGAGGGGIGLSHAIQQLQYEAGGWQVDDAGVALVSGYGLVSYGRGLCTAGTLLARAA